MATAQAGWYPDPSGQPGVLRYWDGNAWTENFMNEADVVAANAQAAAQAQATQTQAAQAAQAQPVQAQVGQQTAYQAAYQTAAQPGAKPTYPVSETDRTLRLIAFVLNIITTVACGVLILPLAWMIPMTVMSWGIYKGTRANSVAFGICTLLFLDFISGILLLISTKEK